MKATLCTTLCIVSFLFFAQNTKAQCPTGNVTLSTQAQVNSFVQNYPNCTQINGNLVIGYSTSSSTSNITNLTPLQNITSITGNIRIRNNAALSTLNGLNNLENIGGHLDIYYNSELINIDEFVGLESIGGRLDIYNNPKLQNLNGLSNLTQIGGYLWLYTNTQLTDISGLQGIDPITIGIHGLHIIGNTNLSICNFPNLCTYLQGSGARTISGNAENCSEESTLINVCNGECPSFTIWNGTSWSNNTPDDTKKAIINGNLTITEDMTFCELLLNSGVLTINSGASLTVNKAIKNTQNEASFIVQNGANLIQVDDEENEGVITVYKNSSNIKHLDYTLWSSPVIGQAMKDFSPQTLWYRIYDYNGQTDIWEQVFSSSTEPDKNFTTGVGYMFRAPNNFVTNPYTYNGEFIGIPNNGTISVAFNPLGMYQSVGNPYPSNISITAFWQENPGTGTLYFWTNINPWDSSLNDGSGDYTANNWATYSLIGGVDVPQSADNDATNKKPNEFVSVGQGFMVEAPTLPSVIFTNAMRTSDEGVFFKAMEEEKHRLWLNLSDETLVLNQTLIGYVNQATNQQDFGIDSKMFGYAGSALYSLIQNSQDNFVIQGRALPFDDNDVVQLGFRANQAGSFTISLADFDGIFAENQDIYLRDNFTQTEHNLKDGDYSFVSEQGTFNSRFEVVYKQSGVLNIAIPDLNNGWVVYKKDDTFYIQSQNFEIKKVAVYDMLGRIVYTSEAEGNSHTLPYLGANQVLVVQVITANEEVLSKKVGN